MKSGRRALVVEPPKEDLRVVTDPSLVVEILQNLVDNAIQYSDDDGRVEITTERAADSIRLTVKDNGVGIPKRHRRRIFERFYRVDAARSRAVGGTGLGLAIARHLAELLGGTIELESAPGEGSEFTLVLPARLAGDASEETELEAAAEGVDTDELRLEAISDPEAPPADARP